MAISDKQYDELREIQREHEVRIRKMEEILASLKTVIELMTKSAEYRETRIRDLESPHDTPSTKSDTFRMVLDFAWKIVLLFAGLAYGIAHLPLPGTK